MCVSNIKEQKKACVSVFLTWKFIGINTIYEIYEYECNAYPHTVTIPVSISIDSHSQQHFLFCTKKKKLYVLIRNIFTLSNIYKAGLPNSFHQISSTCLFLLYSTFLIKIFKLFSWNPFKDLLMIFND